MQVVWEYLVHEENENRCLDKGDTLYFWANDHAFKTGAILIQLLF